MQASDLPTRFDIPFANNAAPSYTRPVPKNSQIGIQDGAASDFDGFPPLTFIPQTAGGFPPFGQDFNGLLNQISAWTRWYSAGGPVLWNSSYSTAIGGYPLGALVASTVIDGVYWLSLADNNTSDPDTGGANWVGWRAGNGFALDVSGTANAIQAVLVPGIASYASIVGTPLTIKKNVLTNTSVVTVDLGLGPLPLVYPDGSPMLANFTNGWGSIPAGAMISIVCQGSSFVLVSQATGPAAIIQVQAGIDGIRPVTSLTTLFSPFTSKGWIFFEWTGSALNIKSRTLQTISGITRIGVGHYQVQMTGDLVFTAGYALCNGGGANPGSRGFSGSGSFFSGVNPAVDCFFGDAGGSGGQSSDPADAAIVIFGQTNN